MAAIVGWSTSAELGNAMPIATVGSRRQRRLPHPIVTALIERLLHVFAELRGRLWTDGAAHRPFTLDGQRIGSKRGWRRHCRDYVRHASRASASISDEGRVNRRVSRLRRLSKPAILFLFGEHQWPANGLERCRSRLRLANSAPLPWLSCPVVPFQSFVAAAPRLQLAFLSCTPTSMLQ